MPIRDKLRDEIVTADFLAARAERASAWPKAKWIEFCEAMLAAGFTVTLYEARETVSKYLTLHRDSKRFVVRFSNHKPNYDREVNGDCDFFVGKCHICTTNSAQAIAAVREFFFGEVPTVKMPARYMRS